MEAIQNLQILHWAPGPDLSARFFHYDLAATVMFFFSSSVFSFLSLLKILSDQTFSHQTKIHVLMDPSCLPHWLNL